ncbi:hypothetical protein GY45DRAFT_1371785 [Cubamyces sp. BRFM 1775]|nr:hypothetical protein GY45DRAFT_1371785 [Cubamyces sp. BRFM 1775]
MLTRARTHKQLAEEADPAEHVRAETRAAEEGPPGSAAHMTRPGENRAGQNLILRDGRTTRVVLADGRVFEGEDLNDFIQKVVEAKLAERLASIQTHALAAASSTHMEVDVHDNAPPRYAPRPPLMYPERGEKTAAGRGTEPQGLDGSIHAPTHTAPSSATRAMQHDQPPWQRDIQGSGGTRGNDTAWLVTKRAVDATMAGRAKETYQPRDLGPVMAATYRPPPPLPPSYGTLPPLTQTTTAEERIALLGARGLLAVMRKPPQGWPDRQPMAPCDLERLPKNRDLERWLATDEAERAVFEVMGVHARAPNLFSIRKNLNDKFALITGKPRMTINVPTMNGTTPGNEDVPTAWLISGLSPDAKRILVEQGTWAMPEITLFFTPTLSVMPTYLLTIDGFRTQDVRAVEDGIRRALCCDRRLADPLAGALSSGGQANGDLQQRVVAFISKMSIDVRPNPDGQTLRAAIWSDPPTFSPGHWRAWRHALCTVQYEVLRGVIGTPCQPIRCALCHGAGHGASECEYPRLEGWTGATSPRFTRKPKAKPTEGGPLQGGEWKESRGGEWMVAERAEGGRPEVAQWQPTYLAQREPQQFQKRPDGRKDNWTTDTWPPAPGAPAIPYHPAQPSFETPPTTVAPHLTMNVPPPQLANQWTTNEYPRAWNDQRSHATAAGTYPPTHDQDTRAVSRWSGESVHSSLQDWNGARDW